jgi:hypothetical protein
VNLETLSQLLSPQNLALAIVFIVPGWVALEAYSTVVPAERRNFGEELIRVIGVSLLNFVLFFVAIPLGLQRVPEGLEDVGVLGALRLVLALAVTPAFLAVAAYQLRSLGLFSRFVVQPEPTAWDSYFRKPREVLVRFYLREEAGGGVVGGYFGGDSSASPYPGVQQVYVEEFWDLDEEGAFLKPKEQTGGAIISREDCVLVEFKELSEEE